jgi:hypothetical protein
MLKQQMSLGQTAFSHLTQSDDFLGTTNLTIGFEQVVESIRAEKQDQATSQLSIRSFFSWK